MIAEELLERYAAGERNFSGIRIQAKAYEQTFSGQDLSNVNLAGSVLSGNWNGVNLSSALLFGVQGDGWDLQGADLTSANLRGTLFAECNLTNCNFSNACLNGVYFTQVIIDGVNFSGANLSGAHFSETSLNQLNLSGADLSGVKGIDITRLQTCGCLLENTCMPDGRLVERINFHKSKGMTAENLLQRYASGERDFFGIELTDADLSRATGWDIDNPKGQVITGTIFTEAILSRTNFSGNDMRACAMSGATLIQCQFIRADLSGCNFTDSDLSGANFLGAKLRGVDFSRTNLRGANMTGVDLTGANMRGADDEGAWYESASFCDTILPDGTLIEGSHPVQD